MTESDLAKMQSKIRVTQADVDANMQDVFNKVKIGTYPLPNNLSWEVVFFIEGMLRKDYDERLGWKELLYIYINELKPEFLAIIKLNENYFKI